MINCLDPLARNRDQFDSCSWCAPPVDFFSLCVDASVRDGGSSAGCSGLARNHLVISSIFDFSMKLQACSVLEAELQAIFHGLSLNLGKGFSRIVVESDYIIAIDLIESVSPTHHPLSYN